MSNKKILVVEDDADVRLGYRVLLRAHNYDTFFAADSVAAVSEARKQMPDLILLDLGLPAGDGFVVLERFQKNTLLGMIPVIVVSATVDTASVDRALLLGASGYVVKSAPVETVGAGVRSVLDGNVVRPIQRSASDTLHESEIEQFRKLRSLTPQQLNVLVMIAEGESNKAVASRLQITEATVKAHITAVLLKLGVQRRTQAAIIAQRALQLHVSIAPDALPDEVSPEKRP